MILPSTFQSIELDTFERSACSPELDDGFRGIRIAGPRSVTGNSDARLPLCGTYRVGARFLNQFYSMANEIVVVAVDAVTHVPRATNLLQEGYVASPSRFDETDRNFDTVALTGWFNLDLFGWMKDLPRSAARYHIFATIGDVTSNVVTTEIKAP